MYLHSWATYSGQVALHSCCLVTCRLQQRQRRRVRLPHLFEHLSASGKASERFTCLENPIYSLTLAQTEMCLFEQAIFTICLQSFVHPDTNLI